MSIWQDGKQTSWLASQAKPSQAKQNKAKPNRVTQYLPDTLTLAISISHRHQPLTLALHAISTSSSLFHHSSALPTEHGANISVYLITHQKANKSSKTNKFHAISPIP